MIRCKADCVDGGVMLVGGDERVVFGGGLKLNYVLNLVVMTTCEVFDVVISYL